MKDLDDCELVDALCAIESGLTEWEVDFVESIARKFTAYGSLTDRQRASGKKILARIEEQQ